MPALDAREIFELRQLCTSAGLTQEALGNLMDSGLSVPLLVKSEAAAMASAKKAGLGMEERQRLRDALRRHKEEVLSAVEPRIVELDEDDAEATHIVAAQQQLAALRSVRRARPPAPQPSARPYPCRLSFKHERLRHHRFRLASRFRRRRPPHPPPRPPTGQARGGG